MRDCQRQTTTLEWHEKEDLRCTRAQSVPTTVPASIPPAGDDTAIAIHDVAKHQVLRARTALTSLFNQQQTAGNL